MLGAKSGENDCFGVKIGMGFSTTNVLQVNVFVYKFTQKKYFGTSMTSKVFALTIGILNYFFSTFDRNSVVFTEFTEVIY